MPSPSDLLHDVATAFLLVLLVIAWSAGSLVSAFAAPVEAHHLEASSAPDQPAGADAALGQGQLDAAAASAKADWQAARPSADLSGLTFSVGDLAGLQLGDDAGTAITVDVDAAGWGWSQMDLGTVVRHEIGHALGVPHGSGLMAPTLSPGESSGVGAEYAEAAPETPADQSADTSTPAAGTTDSSDTTASTDQNDGSASTSGSADATPGTTPSTTGSANSSGSAGSTGPVGSDTATTSDGGSSAGTGSDTVPDSTTVTDSLASSVDKLQSFTAAPASFSLTSTPTGTSGDDVFTIVHNGGGSYEVWLGGVSLVTVTGTDTITIDGLGGVDTLVAPDLAGLWKITKINEGSYQVLGGPTFEFSHIENLTGAATADETYRFSDKAGVTGLIDDGSGRLTLSLGGFVVVTGLYDFVQETKDLKVVGSGGAAASKSTNVLKVGGHDGQGFVGAEQDLPLLGLTRVGLVGTLGQFALAVVTAADESGAWQMFDGTLTSPTFVAPAGISLSLAALSSVSIGMNAAAEDGSWLDLATGPSIVVDVDAAMTRPLTFSSALVSATLPVRIDLDGFLYVAGNVTISRGTPAPVDIVTGLTEDIATSLTAIHDLTTYASDEEAAGRLGRSADYASIWNLPVSSLEFAFTDATFFAGSGFAWNGTDAAIDRVDVPTGAFGLFGGGLNLGFVLLTPLGAASPINKRFLGLTGYVEDIHLFGLEDYLTLDIAHLAFTANSGALLASDAVHEAVVDWAGSFPVDEPAEGDPIDPAVTDPTPAGYHIFVGGLDPPDPALIITASTPAFTLSAEQALITISEFVLIGGSFSLEKGATEYVDITTEDLTTAGRQALVSGISNVQTSDPGGQVLARDATASQIWNLPVSTVKMGIDNGSIFIGYNPGGFPDSITLPFLETDLDDDAVGFFATGISVGLVSATPSTTLSSLKLPSFFALRAGIDLLRPVGLPDELVFYLEGISLEVNRGGVVDAAGPTPSSNHSLAYVDWVASFPGTGGLAIATGSDDTVLIDFDDPVIGVKADLVVLSISDFVHISGGFSLVLGGREKLDVRTGGLTNIQGNELGTTVGNEDESGGVLAADADGSVVYNLPVRTTMIGISNGSIFIGYNPKAPGDTGTSFDISGGTNANMLDLADLSPDAIGFFATGINAAFVLAAPDKPALPDSAFKSQYTFGSFFAMKATIAYLAPVGLPADFGVLTFENVTVSVNSGKIIKKGTVALTAVPSAPKPTSYAFVDWAASFPDTGGLEVPTSASTSVLIDYDNRIVGVSASRLTFAISEFVFIQGGFAFEKGSVYSVDVRTSGLPVVAGNLLETRINGVGSTPDSTDPAGNATRASNGATRIWDLPISTVTIGVSNARIFVGYDPGHAPGASFATDTDGNFLVGADAVGLLATGIQVAVVLGKADPGAVNGYEFSTFVAVSAYVERFRILGIPAELNIDLDGIALAVNTGGAVKTGSGRTATAIPGSKAVVDWASSFPDTDGSDNPLTTVVEGGPLRAGLPVATGNDPIYIDLADDLIGFSATKVTIAISDFVFVQGGFAFQKVNGNTYVDVHTSGLLTGTALATTLNAGTTGAATGFDEDPAGDDTRATRNATTIWDVPVTMTMLGISNASIFIGYNPNEPGTTGTSFDVSGGTNPNLLDEGDLSDGAVGLLANGINLGLVIAKLAVGAPASLKALNFSSFLALRGTINLLTPVGLPQDLVFRFEGVGVSLNLGKQIGTIPNSKAWIDWSASFPELTNPDGSVAKPPGLLVPTGTGNVPILIDFEDPIIGVEAQRVTISIIDFVHITGGFAFEKGSTETVTIKTGASNSGVTGLAECAALQTTLLPAQIADSGLDWELSSDCKTITDVGIDVIKLGVYNASLFLGWNPTLVGSLPFADVDGDGVLDRAELADGAIGFLASGVTLGFVLSAFTPSALATALGNPKFYTVKAHAEFLGLVGLEDDFVLEAENVHIEANLGSKWTTLPNSKAAIDWTSSFPDGYEVETGGDNPSVFMDYDGYLIAGGVSKFTLQISEFVYIAGSFYFEYGDTIDAPTTAALIDVSLLGQLDPTGTLAEYVGCPTTEPDCTKVLQVLTIGAENVSAFVGAGGPYWTDDNEDGVLDDDEINHDAVGLVLADVDFALALFTPVDPVDPTRYIALQASAGQVALVGVEGLTASGKGINIELNISTPTLSGFPVLPVIDFAAYARRNCNDSDPCTEEPFGVKIGAPDSITGDAPTKDFTYDSLLVKASVADLDIDVFGVLAIRGSVALELGPHADLTLTDGNVVTGATTLKLGGANLLGFVGIDGPSWTEDTDGNVVWVDAVGDPCTPGPLTDCQIVRNTSAVGLEINDLDFAIFLGVKTDLANPAVYVAADVRVDSFGLVGLPSGFTAGGVLAISLNVGVGLTGLGGVNFKTTFGSTDPDGENETSVTTGESLCTTANPSTTADPDCDNAEGLWIPTGNPDNPMLLDFTKTFVTVELAGTITIGSYAALVGLFYLDVNEDGLKALVLADLRIGPDIGAPKPLIRAGAIGVLVIDSLGVAADLTVDIGIGNPDVGLELFAKARVLLNTRAADATLEIPDTLWGFLTGLKNGVSPTGGALPAGFTSPGSMTGIFLARLRDCDTPNGTDTDGTTDDNRCYVISGKAPKLINGTVVDSATINALLGTGTVNTDATAAAYVTVVLFGGFNVVGFAQGEGLVGISLRSGAFEMVVDVTFVVGSSSSTGLNVKVAGLVGLYDDGIYLDVAVSIRANLMSLFDLDVNGRLTLDSTNHAGVTGDSYFHLMLAGNVRVLKVVTLGGTLDIAVSDSKWAVTASLDARFGPISLHADGFILSTGSFAFNLGGGIDLTIAGTGIEGYVTAHVSFCNRAGSGAVRQTCLDDRDPTSTLFGANPTTRTFLVGFGGGVDVKLFGITLAGADIFFSGEANLSGRITVKARFTVKILFIRKSVTITIADFYLPVRLVNEGAVPPKLATLSSGVLTLNVGDRANLREVRKTVTQEDYIVKNNGGGSYTIYALGEEETFTGVTSIVGDFGGDDDSFVAFNDLNVTTTLHGGADNDFLAYSGVGCVTGATQATLYGDGGDDDLRGGSCADALYGGAGNDYLDGGAGLDVLDGAGGDDVFAGYLVNSAGETVLGGTGDDVFELIATPTADTIGLVASGTAVNVTSGSGTVVLDSFEDLTLRTQGGDHVTIDGALNIAGIRTIDLVFGSSYVGPDTSTVCDRSTAASAASASCTDTKTFLGGTDTVTLNLTSGADTINIRGGQETARPVLSRGSGALQVTNVLGDVADDVATTHVVWVSHFELIASGSSLATGDRDELVINTLGGDDAVRVTSLATSTTVDGGIGNDSFKVGSNALASNTGGTLNAVVAPLVISGGGGTDSLDVDDSGDTTANTGTLTNALLAGLGLHAEGIAYTGIEALGVTLGSGADTFTVVSTSSTTTTTIHAGPGNDFLVVKTVSGPTSVFGDADNDTVTVGSQGSTASGVLDQILAFLSVSGGTGNDAVTLDDTADTTGEIGYMTDSRVSGLGMIVDAAHTAAQPAWSVTILNATGGSWSLTVGGATVSGLAFDAKAKVVQDALNGALTGASVTVTRSPVTRIGGTTYLIRWVGSFTGAPPVLNASALTASTGSASGVLGTMTSGYIDYDTFETFTLGLGSGGDFLDVDSTQTGTTGSTTVNAGGGDDVLTVETTSGPTRINGQAGNDVLMVNPLPNTTAANGIAGGTSRTGNVLTLDGGNDSDTFVIAVFNTGDSRVDVRDVDDGASNVLQVDGTSGDDIFVLRSGLVAAVNTAIVGTTGIQKSFGHAELVTYSNTINTGLVVNGLDGDDVVAMDDNSTSTTVNGGAGADRFYVGQLYGDSFLFDPAYAPVLTDTTRGQLTRGVSYATTINGGTGNDVFSILRNVAALQLYGEDGDDTFVLRTFLLESDPTSDALSKVSTGSGADLVSYVINAPVAVDGGDGFDTLVVIGTEADDIFVISKDGIWGAGRFVSFIGIEKVDVDGAEGDDFFYVVSTSPTVQTRIFGGLGSDMTFVGSAAPLVVADDLQGHSGLVQNSVETSLGAWQNLPVDGIAAEITDNDEPAAAMTPTGSGTLVKEGGVTDSYVLTLAKAPTGTVFVTVSAPLLSPDDEDARRRTVLVSLTGTGGWARSVTALFDSTHLSHTIYVMAIDDLTLENDRYVVLQHLVVQNDGLREYDGLPIANAVVRVIDNDQPAVTVVADAPVRVVEGGPNGSYELSLARPLTGTGTVTVRVSAGPQTRVSLTGAAGSWAATVDVVFDVAHGARTVYVQGIDDATVEGNAFDTITQAIVASTDAGYAVGMSADPVSVLVDDDDTPSVRVTETDGGTHVVEAGDTDFYWLALDRNPCRDAEVGAALTSCSVTVRATALQTGTRDGTHIRNDVQVEVSLDGVTYYSNVAVTFNGNDWATQRKIWVRAVNDTYIDGSDYQAFAAVSVSRVNQVQGPLAVFGGINPDASYELPAPYMLPGEHSDALVTTPNAAFDVIEANQVDTLVVDNRNDVAAETGTLTSGHLTGLGLGGNRTIGGREIDGGITYQDLENLVVRLGTGQDTFTVLSTHTGRTEITGGSGNDVFTVRTIGGVTRLAGDAGDDTFVVGDAGLLDHLDSLLVLVGGDGFDTAVLDDSAETDDQLATITQGTVTGLDMVASAAADRVYSVTVHGTGTTFTITVDGRTTVPLAVGASAAAVQAALQSLLFPPNTCGLLGGSTPAQDSRCAQSVYVWKDGSTYLIGFTGELASTDPVFSSTMTDLARPDGVSYSELEDITVNLGSGNDGVNVRGTTASTHVNTGAGDDLVFVSDAANLGNVAGVLNAVDLSHLLAALTTAATTRDVEALFAALLHGTLTTDDVVFTGSLDLVTGALSVDTGAGSNTLAVSDHADPDADRAFTITDNAILGVAPAAITYTSTAGDLAGQGYWTRQADSGLFGRGISVFLGTGDDIGRIASVRGGALGTSPYGATVTTVWTGAGNDSIGIGANLPTTGLARLVVHGQTGNDSIVAQTTATQPVILFGDEGSDTLVGGAGDDLVFGDSGRVYYLRPVGAAGYDIVLGGAPVGAHLTNPHTQAVVTGDSAFTTLDVLRTAATGIGTGDAKLAGGAGNDAVLGGDGADTILGDAGNDLLFGDYGWVGALSALTFVDTRLLPLSMAVHPFAFVSVDTDDAHGGNDVMFGVTGDDIMLGQQGADEMWGNEGNDDLIGGHNVAGGSDVGDFIMGGAGNDVVVGDNGSVLRTGSSLTTQVRVLLGTRLYTLVNGSYYGGSTVGASSANPTGVETRAISLFDHGAGYEGRYGIDTINGEDGDDVIFGGLGNDILRGGNGSDYIEGNGGADLIIGGLGQDDLIGGSSELFGLKTPAMRPDERDTIYGGDQTLAGRNSAGDTTAAAHAIDADVILGDNGNIFKMVRTLNAGFPSFAYDTAAIKVIPRIVVLLDYTPTGDCGKYSLVRTDRAAPTLEPGTCTNIGGGDFLHGEGGDDVIHGMSGDDALYGDGQDDDLYGEAGQDWISGGAGNDGIVGDDGLVLTSRNGSAEQLNYLDTATVQRAISGNGPHHSATVNVTGTLLKAVDLEPFYVGWNDVLYGGLGNDFVHGGEGDDAISGGEALTEYYTLDPWTTLARFYQTANLLQFGVRDPEEFLLYNENDPMRLVKVCPTGSTTGCLPFLTTADATGNDGDDALFGDGGNDWMSGGTGVDHLYGGWGHDLLDVDDDKTTLNGANSKVDGDNNADYAFGGAGRDVLIANTKSDRLIDWIGEFNSYLVPFNQFGASTIWRASAPAERQFLYDLSKADGADQTRTPANDPRNGEPYGELGLTSSADAEWGDQHGAPDDPQPGNGGTFSSTTALAAPTGTTAWVGSAGSSTTTTTFAKASTTTTTTAGAAKIASATVAENKKGGTLTVTLAAKTTVNVRIAVVVVGLDETARLVTTTTVWAGATSITGTYALGLVGGGQYEFAWMPSTDPAKSDLVLVIRRIA